MFGYATDETEESMPLTLVLAHKLNEKIANLRRNGLLWWARPDSKTQVNIYHIHYKLNNISVFIILNFKSFLNVSLIFKLNRQNHLMFLNSD